MAGGFADGDETKALTFKDLHGVGTRGYMQKNKSKLFLSLSQDGLSKNFHEFSVTNKVENFGILRARARCRSRIARVLHACCGGGVLQLCCGRARA